MAAIDTSGLEVRYGETIAVTGVNLTVPAGSLLSVIGPNGAGKSALLNALAGTAELSGGSCCVSGAAPALVLQATDVDRSLPITVFDVVSLSRYSRLGLFRRFGPADRHAVTQAIERLEIANLATAQFHNLSGGERQRVLVAQGLAQQAEVLLLDEPVNGLDIISRAIITEVIGEEVHSGKTVVVTTHSLDDARHSDQVLLLSTCPICVGRPQEVLTEKHLSEAFGGNFMRVGNKFVLDDPHHAH
jgi:iron complex transport system ATP-binding protein